MSTVAFRMQLKPGCKDEYQARHDAIWLELTDLLHEAGIRDYWIFFDEPTHRLFAVMTCADSQVQQRLAHEPLMRRWWAHMAELMDTNADGSPASAMLPALFHMP